MNCAKIRSGLKRNEATRTVRRESPQTLKSKDFILPISNSALEGRDCVSLIVSLTQGKLENLAAPFFTKAGRSPEERRVRGPGLQGAVRSRWVRSPGLQRRRAEPPG